MSEVNTNIVPEVDDIIMTFKSTMNGVRFRSQVVLEYFIY